MNKISNLVWKLFSITMVFLYNHNDCMAASNNLESLIGTYCGGNSYRNAKIEPDGQQIVICNSGYYLEACDGIKLGINWLKGINNVNYEVGKCFLDGDDNYYTNIENLSKFFERETVNGKSGNKCDSAMLDKLLVSFCSPIKKSDSDAAQFTCTRCPGNGDVAASTVNIIEAGNEKYIDCDSWDIHTITDCVANRFSDSTGEYKYVDMLAPDNSTSTTESSNKIDGCKYSNPQYTYGSALNINRIARYYGETIKR